MKKLLFIFALIIYLFSQPNLLTGQALPPYYKYVYDSLEIINTKIGKQKEFDILPTPNPRIYLLVVDTIGTIPLKGYLTVLPKYTITTTDGKNASFIGAWIHTTKTTAYNGTISYSDRANAYVKYDFVGNGIELISENHPTHGIAAISIDNGTEFVIDLYGPVEKRKLVVFSTVLPYGTHTITVKVTGFKNVASKGTFVVIDGFTVRK